MQLSFTSPLKPAVTNAPRFNGAPLPDNSVQKALVARLPKALADSLTLGEVGGFDRGETQTHENLTYLRKLDQQGVLDAFFKPFMAKTGVTYLSISTKETPATVSDLDTAENKAKKLENTLFQNRFKIMDAVNALGAKSMNGLYFLHLDGKKYVLRDQIMPEGWLPGRNWK